MEEPKNKIIEIKDDKEKNPDKQEEEKENDKENIENKIDENAQNQEEQKKNQEPQEVKEEKNENDNEEAEKKIQSQNQEEPKNEIKILENKEEEKDKDKKEKEKDKEKEKEQEKAQKDDEKKKKKEKVQNDSEKNKSQKQIKEKKERKEIMHAYFIENHLENHEVEIQLDNSKFASDLEIKFQDKYSFGENNYYYTIYCFKISNIKKEKNIVAIIKLKDKEKNKNFETKIVIDDFTKDAFLYDFEFKSYQNKKDKIPLYFSFSLQEQFEFYIHLLRKILKLNQRTNENEDLILSTHKMLNKLDKKYPFSFYLIIFLECFSCAVTYNHLMEFNYNKIDNPESLSPIKIKQIKNILNVLKKEPQKVLDFIKEEENKKKCRIKLFSIILYYNYLFDKDELTNLLKDKDLKEDIYTGLYTNKELFQDLKLTLEQFENFINVLTDFSQVYISLSYTKDIYELLQIIKNNFKKIVELYKKEGSKGKGKNKNNINLDNFVVPNTNDNLEEISKLYIDLIKEQHDAIKKIFIIFDSKLIEKYIRFYEKENLNNLFYLKNIIQSLKSDSDFKIKDMNTIIYETFIYLCENHKLNNNDILDFINQDEDFNKRKNKLTIIDGIDISSINEEFSKKWKNINFKKDEDKFIEKVTNLVNDLKDFNKLFILLDISKNEIQREFNKNSLKFMQNKFISLFEGFNDQKYETFEEDLIQLIFYSDQKKYDIDNFLIKNIQEKINFETVNKIYIKLLSKYKAAISESTKNIIINFFLENPNNDNPEILVNLIEECEDLRLKLLENIDKYIIEKDKFWVEEKRENLLMFKGLLDAGYITHNEYRNINYIASSNQLMEELYNNILNGDVLYKDINSFYSNNKENELNNRLMLICLNDSEKSENLKNILDEYIKTINVILKDLELMESDLAQFLKKKEKDNILILRKMIFDIKNGFLNCYKNYKPNYDELISKFKAKAEIRSLRKKSSFFMNIYQAYLEKYKNDDELCIKETELAFNDMIKIFSSKGIYSLESNTLDLCINTIKGKKKNGIDDDVDYLIKIFKDDIKEEYNKNKIVKSMIILSKKDDIQNIASSISSFIKKTELQVTDFSKQIENIINNLEKTEENLILDAIEQLNNCHINIDVSGEDNNNKDNYLNVLLKLEKNIDSIPFLLKTKVEDCRNLQEIVGEMDDKFLNTNDILDFEKCVELMNNLGDEKTIKNRKDLDAISLFIDLIKEQDGIELYFIKYFNNYSEIKNALENMDKSEASRQIIGFLCQNSKFTLTNINNNFFHGNYYDSKKESKDIDLEELFKLRDRAQLTKNVEGESKQQEKNKKFIDKVSEIYSIDNLLHKIYLSGYPEDITIKIKIYNLETEFEGFTLENPNYQDIILKLNSILDEVKQNKIKAYKESPLIRFIYGRQFNLIYNCLNKKENEIEKDKILPFLRYFSNNLISQKLKDFEYTKTGNIYKDLIDNSENYLRKTLLKYDLTLEDIYKDTLINQKTKYNGLYLYYCNQSNQLEIYLFQIYKHLTNNIPVAQTILLCNKETTNEEIIAFLYRAILCKFNSCFIIGGIELLEFDKKSILFEYLSELMNKEYKNMESCLIILYTSKETDIYKSLESLKYKKPLNLKREIEKLKIDDEKGNDEKKVEVISSDKSGVGKSTQIKLEVENKNKNYFHFPFGGVFNRQDVIKRLKKLQKKIEKKKKKNNNINVIHLDLYDTDQTELMTEFLFSILITKLYGQNEDIFFLPKEIEIKIEIPNGFIDFINKFSLLKLFPMKKYFIKSLPKLIVPKDIKNNIQIVSNYLKAFNEGLIDNNDLYIEGITPRDFMYYDTMKKAEILSQEVCEKLIFKEIKRRIDLPNYYQIKSFIDVLASQFIKFNQSYHLNAYRRKEFKTHDDKIRSFIIESFIKITRHFTEGAFTKLIESQNETHKEIFGGVYDESKDTEKAIESLAQDKHDVISFNQIELSLLFFHEGTGEGFSIITNKNRNDPDYINLFKLLNYEHLNNTSYTNIPDYNNYKPMEFLEKLKDILDIPNPVKKDPTNTRKSLEEITGTYVFTADNFVKMILILLRIRANIPIIMMGETGCGKTSLIRKLSEMLNRGENKLKILNIHAGISDKDIIYFIKKVIKEAKILTKSEKKEKSKFEKKGQIFIPKKIWVFFDEINTCKSMGLISEIMCKRTYQGNKIPSNIVFIAACNPYRHEKNNLKQKAGLDLNDAHKEKKYLNQKQIEKLKKSSKSTLVYTVNPLPHSLLNFVFDFGNVEGDDEKKYIESIILEPIQRLFEENKGNMNEEDFTKIHQFAKKMISSAQKFIREKNGKSSVSLREIRRFNIFYEFFFNYLKKKKEMNTNSNRNDNPKKGLNELCLQIYSIILSVFSCYYLRITDNATRKEFREKMNDILTKFHPFFENQDFLNIPQNEESYIIKNIELEAGIAKNRALLDNIFSLFIAINNKVPIFIVGKPGCSKSLSVQLINKAMKGSSSNNELFKQYPKIILNSYQGSMASTSKGVLNVFQKAKNKLKNLSKENRKNNISMIFFDEMGLAEHSPNNPLKVIHSQLEYDQKEDKNEKIDEKEDKKEDENEDEDEVEEEEEKEDEGEDNNAINKETKEDGKENKIENEDKKEEEEELKVAFVGISNWTLDASKMNRGMFLSIPDPEKEDTEETALTIGKSYNNQIGELYTSFYKNLGVTYFDYKNYLIMNHSDDGKKDFHGNRDFYHLIKNAARLTIDYYNSGKIVEDNFVKIATISIERNFGGLQFDDSDYQTSLEVIKDIYSKNNANCEVIKKFDVVSRIKENINDLKSRYLLVISKSSVSTFIISSILLDLEKDYSLYVGSKFPNDIQSEEYSLKILNKIQLHMEQGKILILKNFEPIYPALYDLFNQNFTEVGKKNYARIAIGSSTNAFSLVDKNFKCIVIVDEKQIDEEEPPFLNRFEKQIISFEYLLEEKYIKTSKIIYEILTDLINYDKKIYKGINYDLKNIFINFDLEEIRGIIFQLNKEQQGDEDIFEKIISKIALTLPQDILVCLKFNGFKNKYKDNIDKNGNDLTTRIMNAYNQGKHNNLSEFLKSMTYQKNVIYTFTGNLDIIKEIKEINNKKFGKITNDNLFQIKISSLKTENEFEELIDDFYRDDKKKVCLIRFRPNEGTFLNYIQFFIKNKEKDLLSQKKEEENKSQKIFIFIIHLIRIFNQNVNDEKNNSVEKEKIDKKILKETISHLSEYYQIFVDDLNGNCKCSLDEIIKMNKKELFQNCLDLDEELINNFYLSLSCMNYEISSSIGDINAHNYINKLIKYISKEKELRKAINECLLKQIKNEEEDIITKIFKEKNAINQADIDIIGVIIRHLSISYTKLLKSFYYKAEKDHFFSSLLFFYNDNNDMDDDENKNENNYNSGETNINEDQIINNENNNIRLILNINNIDLNEKIIKKLISKILKIYLENFVFMNSQSFNKKLEITLGLILPGMKTCIESLIKKFRNENYLNYKKNERNIRTSQSTNELEEDYYNKLRKYTQTTMLEFKKDKLYSEIIKELNGNELNIFYNLLLNDYYTIFIDKHINKSKISQNVFTLKKVLNLLYSLRAKESLQLQNKENIEIFSNVINWIEAYSDEITIILQIFSKLNKLIEELYEQINDIILKKKLKYDYSPNHKLSSIVNTPFFYVIESIFTMVTSKEQIYTNKKVNSNEFFELLNTNKDILNQALQININLRLNSKEIFSLQELLAIIDFFYKNNINTNENIINLIEFFSHETPNMTSKTEIELIDNINNLYDLLINLIGKYNNYGKLIAFILENEYKKSLNESFRLKILKYILNDKNILYYSSKLIKSAVFISCIPEKMEKNLANLQLNTKQKELFNNCKEIDYLDELIINSFEYEILRFFDNIPYLNFENNSDNKNLKYFENYCKDKTKKINILYNLPLEIFNECLEFLEKILYNKEKEITNERLCKLYSITYIKIYLFKFVNIIYNESDIGNISEIINTLVGTNKNNFRKIIKIYTFKLFFNFSDRNWEIMKHFNFENNGFNFITDFQNEFNIKEESFLTYCFLPMDNEKDYQKYINEKTNFEKYQKDNFKNYDLINFIKENELDIFISLSINKIISNYGFKDYLNIKTEYNQYLTLCNSMFINNKQETNEILNDNLIKLLSLFFDYEKYNKKIKPLIENKQKVLNQELFEIILFGFRLCAQTLDIKGDSNLLYSSLFNSKCLKNLKKSYIPGNDNIDNIKVNSFLLIEDHLLNLPADTGCYVCSCGFYYSIGPCGFPTQGFVFKCPECKEYIGYGEKKIPERGAPNHGMVLRQGHYRIFKDPGQKKEQMKLYDEIDENIPNKTLEEYRKEVIQPILDNSSFGLNKISKSLFLKKDKNIRKMSQISYRLLNFLIYNHLFYANCLNYISKKELEEIALHEKMTCLEIMQNDWELLKEALEAKNITFIQIFLNLIFKRLSNLIKECKIMTKQEEREEFELKVEELINNCIKEYPEYEKEYLKNNEDNLGLDSYNLKTIISEIIQPSEDIYKEEEYPYLKYFTYTKYRTKNDLIKMIGPKKECSSKYPLLNQYLSADSKPKKLKYLKEFNEFTNYMIEKYSCQISRNNAKKISIKDEDIYKDSNFKKKLQSFINLWNNHIKKYAIKYKCRENMTPKEFKESDKLIYFLNDDGELGFGIYLAAAYQCFIDWQNNFLKPIINSEIQNRSLNYYIDNLKNKVPVQEANNEALLINNFGKSEFRDFDEILYSFSNRNIFNENGKINYLKYNSFIFDYTSIEEELGDIILPGKCLFDNVDKLNFMVFWGEGFRGGKSDTLIKFYEKYPQKDLDTAEKDTILKYISDLIKDDENQKYDFSKFFSSLNLIIFYLLNNNFKSEEKISPILKDHPKYLKLSNDCEDFFSEKGVGKDFKINKLMNIFFYIEHLCFENLCTTLNIEYQKEIKSDTVEKIKKEIANNKNEKYYTIKDLAAALRRYISRYLVGQREEVEIDEKRELYYELTRQDLWEEKIGKLDNLDILIKNQLEKYKLTVGQSLSLYKIIGEEDKIEIKITPEPEPEPEPESDDFSFKKSNASNKYQ